MLWNGGKYKIIVSKGGYIINNVLTEREDESNLIFEALPFLKIEIRNDIGYTSLN